MSTLDFYDITKPRPNWKKWTEDLSNIQKKYISKLRKSYELLEDETGIKVIEVILPKSPGGVYWMDYPLDYAQSLYPNLYLNSLKTTGKAYMLVIFKIDEYKHLSFEGLRSSIQVQHFGIKKKYKKRFEDYMLDFTNKASMNDPKLTWGPKDTDLIYFYL
jgi:hypothetical protein